MGLGLLSQHDLIAGARAARGQWFSKPITGTPNELASCPARRRVAVHVGGNQGQTAEQHQPQKRGYKKGPRCCAAELRRNQQRISQPSW